MLGAVGAAALLVLLMLGARLHARRQRRREPERDLLRLCYGDREQAERLIGIEQRRAPGVPRSEAAARAIEARRRDNR